MNGDKDFFPWSADHVNRIGNLPVDLYSAICYDNKKTCQYSSSSSNILYLNILYIYEWVWEKYMDAAVYIGSNPVSKHQIQPECGK